MQGSMRIIERPRDLKQYFPEGKFSTLSEDKVCGQIKRREFILFVGSAISIWEPSSLPTGQTLKDALICGLPQANKNPIQASSWFVDNYKKAPQITLNPYPFLLDKEHLKPFSLIRYARPLESILQCFNDAHPNFGNDLTELFEPHNQSHQASPVHRDLVRLSYHSKYPIILTTNWDCQLAHAAKQMDIPYQLYFYKPEVRSISEIANESPKKIHIFKIHGTLGARRLEAPLIFTLTQEAQRLPIAQFSLLEGAFDLPVQLIIGYSCGESDLFPAFCRLPATNLIWNIKNPDSNPLLSYMLASKQASVVFADMRSLIGKACHAIGIDCESDGAQIGNIDWDTKACQALKGWSSGEVACLLIHLCRGLPLQLREHLLTLLQDDINVKIHPLPLERRAMEEAELSAFDINFESGKYDLGRHNLKRTMQQRTAPIVYFRAARKGGLLVACEQSTTEALEYLDRLEKEVLEFFKWCNKEGRGLPAGAVRVRTQILLDRAALLLKEDAPKPIKTVDEFDEVTISSLAGWMSGDLDLEARLYLLKALVQLKNERLLRDAIASVLFAKERYWLAGHFTGINDCEALFSKMLEMKILSKESFDKYRQWPYLTGSSL